MAFHHQITTISGLLGLTLLASGCPDSEARFNEFLDATKDERPQAESGDGDGDPTGDGDGDGDTGLINMDGKYLFALETSLGPDTPLQFVTTVSGMTIAPDGMTATADFSFQPLSLDVGGTTNPREFVGDTARLSGHHLRPRRQLRDRHGHGHGHRRRQPGHRQRHRRDLAGARAHRSRRRVLR